MLEMCKTIPKGGKIFNFFDIFWMSSMTLPHRGSRTSELCHFFLLKWLVVRVRRPITVSRSLLHPYYFQASAAQNSLLMLDLLRQCLSLEIKKAIKAGSPLVLSINCSPPFQETILFILYYLQFTLSGISFVLDKHLEDKFVPAFALNGH